jgi:hypothetical protein
MIVGLTVSANRPAGYSTSKSQTMHTPAGVTDCRRGALQALFFTVFEKIAARFVPAANAVCRVIACEARSSRHG